MKNNKTIYHTARMDAIQAQPLLSNRARAAEEVHVSVEALFDYENGNTLPPCDVVQSMVEAYDAHDLRGAHIRAYCPLMSEYGSETPSELQGAALGWAVTLRDVHEVMNQFATIARNGKISHAEDTDAEIVRSKALEIMRVMQETIDAIDKARAVRTRACRA